MEGDTYTLSFSRLHGATLPEPSTKLNRVFWRFLSSSGIHFHSFQKTKQTPQNIEEICEHISLNERKIDQLVWDFEDRIYARWALEHLEEEIKVKIVDTDKAKAVCYEKMFGMKVVLENYKGQKLFTKLRVKIKSADVITKVIVATIKY